MDLSSSYPYSDWTRLKGDYICFARISLFCLLINCFSKSLMLLSEPISKSFHIKLTVLSERNEPPTQLCLIEIHNKNTQGAFTKIRMSQLYLCRLRFSKSVFMQQSNGKESSKVFLRMPRNLYVQLLLSIYPRISLHFLVLPHQL